MEWVTYLAGERHADEPACVSKVLTRFCIAFNDALPDEPRQKLRPYLARTIGTAGDDLDDLRAWTATDWLLRIYTPTWLALAGLGAAAARLYALPVIAVESVNHAMPHLESARHEAGVAKNAAKAAAAPVARAAVRSATKAAARAAAGEAAQEAATLYTLDPEERDAWRVAADPMTTRNALAILPGVHSAEASRARLEALRLAVDWDAAKRASETCARRDARDAAVKVAMATARRASWAAVAEVADAAGDAAATAARAALAPTVTQLQESAFVLLDRMLPTVPLVLPVVEDAEAVCGISQSSPAREGTLS